jgi:hypothetical protein
VVQSFKSFKKKLKLYILRASRLCDGGGYKNAEKKAYLCGRKTGLPKQSEAVDNLSTFSFKRRAKRVFKIANRPLSKMGEAGF